MSIRRVKLEVRIAAWRDDAASGRKALPADHVESLIAAYDDPVYERSIRDAINPNMWLHHLGNADFQLSMGKLDEAEHHLETLENGYQFVLERLRSREAARLMRAEAAVAEKERATSEQNRKNASVSKRKPWAEVLADSIDSWEEIPAGREKPLEIDTAAIALGFYRDGEKVCCVDMGRETTRADVGTLKKRSFLQGYLNKKREASSA
ncbi:hypothetical protein [Mesorhizobium sp. CN2-181]|uniref:hypothetical protein n=1 Tax=Mesorhizobium yinganensis TaxID=3157707 RepID=UPI0032B85AB6